MFRFLVITFCVVGSVLSLRLEDAEEGSCRGIQYKALPHVDLDFIDSLSYIPAMNRYHLYRLASGHPRFREMREFELYYKACITQNATYSVGDGSAFGFGGRVLGSYSLRPRREQPTIIDATPIVGPYDPARLNRLQQFITLTDHRTFAVLANCWVGLDQRSFYVYSSNPDLSLNTKKLIEEHAVSLGFKRDQIVFLSYDSCGGEPVLQPDSSGGSLEGNFGEGLGWSQKDVSSGIRNPSISVPVPLPNIDTRSTGKIVTSRATINPIPGNNSLRRANNGNVGVSARLSLATAAGAGWTR